MDLLELNTKIHCNRDGKEYCTCKLSRLIKEIQKLSNNKLSKEYIQQELIETFKCQ